MEGFDNSLEEAALDLGENGWMTFWRVTFPIVLPGIVASLLLTFTISFDEFVLAFFSIEHRPHTSALYLEFIALPYQATCRVGIGRKYICHIILRRLLC